MNTTVGVQLIFLCLLTIIFFLSGVILNSLVIITILKSTQLRKKLCHFLIMVLSCSDLIAALLSTLTFFLQLTLLSTENNNLLTTMEIYRRCDNLFAGISMLALLVMSIERYFGAYHPIFHRTSVTRRRLLTLLGLFSIFPAALLIISINQIVISYPVAVCIFLLIYLPPFIFFNYKLFKISTKLRRKNVISPQNRIKVRNLKHFSSCLLAVACLMLFSIPSFIYIAVSAVEGSTSSDARLSYMWLAIAFRMNCTFNSLIFFWKNKVLRIEGIKILQALKARVFGTETNTIV